MQTCRRLWLSVTDVFNLKFMVDARLHIAPALFCIAREMKMMVENVSPGGGGDEGTTLGTVCIFQVAGSCVQHIFSFYSSLR